MSNRTSLYAKQYYTITFLMQWGTYEEWKNALSEYLTEDEQESLTQQNYKILKDMGGTLYLKSNDYIRNNSHAALSWIASYENYIKEKEYYDLSIEDLTKSKSDIENRLYTMNLKKGTTLEDNYLDGGTKSTINNEKMLIEDLGNVERRIKSLKNPKEKLFNTYLVKIALNFQPQSKRNNILNTGGELW